MTRAQAVLLAAVIAAAAVLRATGLDWGLRHPPDPDEAAFVGNVHRMIAAGDLDHRFYEYPGFFFYSLYPVLRVVMGTEPPTPAAYLAARAVVAAWGVLCVALCFVLGRVLFGSGTGLLAAALAATSLVAVQTAHAVRPDVALSALFALALLLFTRLGDRLRDDLLAGAALGLACATKFSGVFLLPPFLAARLLAPGRRARGLLAAGLAAAAVFALASPYSLLHLGEFVEGVETQVSYHYEENTDPERTKSYLGMARLYVAIWAKGLGLPATVMSVLALAAVAARAPRRWLPVVLLPVTAILVLATSHVRHDRFLLPALPAAFVLAGAGAAWLVSRLAERARPAGWGAAALLAVLPPAADSVGYLEDISRPLTADRAVDWARVHLPRGARVVTRLDLGFPPGHAEVLRVPALAERARLLEADFVVATHRDDRGLLTGLAERARFVPSGRYNGPEITVLSVPSAARPAYMDVAVAAIEVTGGQAAAGALIDGDPATWWHTDVIQRAGDAVVARLSAPARLARLELDLGDEPRFAARELSVQVPAEAGWRTVPTVAGRTRVEEQSRLPRGHSQVFLLARPTPAAAVRLVLTRDSGRRWGMAGLRIQALPE